MTAYQDRMTQLSADVAEFDAWLAAEVSGVLDRVQRGTQPYEVRPTRCGVEFSIMQWDVSPLDGRTHRTDIDPRCDEVRLSFPNAEITFSSDPDSWPELPPLPPAPPSMFARVWTWLGTMTRPSTTILIALALASAAGCEKHSREKPVPETYTQEQYDWLKVCVAHTGRNASMCVSLLHELEALEVTP
jgi:hypothetical protein